jgi:hypothetical protein
MFQNLMPVSKTTQLSNDGRHIAIIIQLTDVRFGFTLEKWPS